MLTVPFAWNILLSEEAPSLPLGLNSNVTLLKIALTSKALCIPLLCFIFLSGTYGHLASHILYLAILVVAD